MADARSPETRLARLESCVARLEERVNADRENREQWRAETLRRLDDLNHNAARYAAELAQDRERYLTKEMYEARHTELGGRMEANFREQANRAAEHERDDLHRHEIEGGKLEELIRFKSDMQGRLIAMGAIASLLGLLGGWIFHFIK